MGEIRPSLNPSAQPPNRLTKTSSSPDLTKTQAPQSTRSPTPLQRSESVDSSLTKQRNIELQNAEHLSNDLSQSTPQLIRAASQETQVIQKLLSQDYLGKDKPLAQAKQHRIEADNQLVSSRTEKGKAKFKRVGHAVVNRNREFKSLAKHVATSDISTEKDRGVLWSGDLRSKDGKTQATAMHTAQHFAKETNRKTVEMTDGGGGLDKYTNPEGNSFGKLNERFAFLVDQRPSELVNQIEDKQQDLEALKKTNASGNAVQEALLKKELDVLKKALQVHMETIPEEKKNVLLSAIVERELNDFRVGVLKDHKVGKTDSPAGALWDVISKRFADGLDGEVNVVHAYREEDHDVLNQGPLQDSTLNQQELPIVHAKSGTAVKHLFGNSQDLQEHLRLDKAVQRDEPAT